MSVRSYSQETESSEVVLESSTSRRLVTRAEWTGIVIVAAIGALGVVMAGGPQTAGNPSPPSSETVPRTITSSPAPAAGPTTRDATTPQDGPADRPRAEAPLPSVPPDQRLVEEAAPARGASGDLGPRETGIAALGSPPSDPVSTTTASDRVPAPSVTDAESAAVVVGTLAGTARRADAAVAAGPTRLLRTERGPDPRDTGSLPATRNRSAGKPVSVLVRRPAPAVAPSWALPAALAPTN